MISDLAKYKKIGWDIDGTTIGHHKSHLIHEFILSHPEIEHYFVTFRSGGWEHDVWRDLERNYPGVLDKSLFTGLLAMSEEMFDDAALKDKIILLHDQAEIDYVEFKGRICAQHGIEVLVDDMPEHTRAGCAKYGVEYIHPDDL